MHLDQDRRLTSPAVFRLGALTSVVVVVVACRGREPFDSGVLDTVDGERDAGAVTNMDGGLIVDAGSSVDAGFGDDAGAICPPTYTRDPGGLCVRWRGVDGFVPLREWFVATRLADDRVLACGGIGVAEGAWTEPLPDCSIFDPLTESWTATTAMPSPRFSALSVLLADGRVLVVGGWTFAPDGLEREPQAAASVFDPASSAWAEVTLPAELHLGGAAATDGAGRAIFAGGYAPDASVGGEASRTVEAFDDIAGTWVRLPDLTVPRIGHRLARLADDSLIVAGGAAVGRDTGRDEDAYRVVERLPVDGGAWEVLPAAQFGRWRPALFDADGGILVVGGTRYIVDAGVPYFVERYDFATGAWSTRGEARIVDNFEAARLADGRILIVGDSPDDSPTYPLRQLAAQIGTPDGDVFAPSIPLAAFQYLNWYRLFALDDGRVLVGESRGLRTAVWDAGTADEPSNWHVLELVAPE